MPPQTLISNFILISNNLKFSLTHNKIKSYFKAVWYKMYEGYEEKGLKRNIFDENVFERYTTPRRI